MSDPAAELFEAFHGRAPKHGEIRDIELDGTVEALAVGDLDGIIYQVEGDDKPSIHRFDKKARPLLFVSADGSQIYIVKGRYRFTDKGFVG